MHRKFGLTLFFKMLWWGIYLKNAESLALLCLTFSVLIAERPRFELGIRFWRIHAFQACLFSHSSIAPFRFATAKLMLFSDFAMLICDFFIFDDNHAWIMLEETSCKSQSLTVLIRKITLMFIFCGKNTKFRL